MVVSGRAGDMVQTAQNFRDDCAIIPHCLEHMRNADIALKNWFRILKPGVHLLVIVPDEDMYEQGIFPSTFNSDHKWTFTVFKTASWSNRSRNLVELIPSLGESADLI